jgi:hypothetical protein
VPAALYLKGTSLLATGEPHDAASTLAQARTEAEQLGFRPILWRIDAVLSGIAASAGDAANAAELRTRAKGIVEEIAGTLDDEELRASFLALPDVAAVTTA